MIAFDIATIIDSDFVFMGEQTVWRATTPLQVVYQMTSRDGNVYPEDEYLMEDVQYESYDFTVTPVSEGVLTSLGPEKKWVKKCPFWNVIHIHL